jgi:hemerythrin superfamily protein
MTDAADVVDLLAADHRAIGELLDELDAAERPDAIRHLYLRITAELSAHEAAEQDVVFPALAGADAEAARLGEHREINELLDAMRTLPPLSHAFTKRGSALVLDVRAHFQHEEEHLFPLLRATCTPDRLVQLATEAQRAKAAAPAFPVLARRSGVA